MMVRRRPQRAGNASFAGLCMAAFLLVGCAEIEARYGPRDVRAPPPISAGLSGAPGAEPIKPIGVGPTSAERPLTRPVIVTAGVGTYNPLVRVDADTGGAEDLVSLNFESADIREVVEVVLGETLGLNYVFDERVSGTVTARTTEPVSRSAVLAVLENVLALNGAALVPSPGGYAVVPVEEAGTLARVVVTPSSRGPRAGVGAYVIPLRAASVSSVSEIAGTLVSPGAALAADPARNLLIYTGPAAEAQSIADLVSVLDVDVLSGKQLGLFPVKASRASDVAAEVELLYADPALGDGQVRFLPIERLNAILVVAARPRQMDQVGFWIEQLDRASAGAGRQVYVYHARNGRAVELADVLGRVFVGATQDRAEEAGAVAPGLSPVTIFRPGRPAPDDDGEPLVSRSPFADPGGGAGAAEGLRIVADERNNAVVVIGTEEEFRLIEATLRQIDILPLQVLIEATIAEVTLNDGLEYGLQWAFANGNVRGNLTNNALGRVAPSFPGFNFIFDTSDVRLVLSALAEVTDVKVISSPQLMVLDNQPARLQVGDQVPVQTGETITDGGTQFNSIEYIDTGVILEVTPRVNASGLVTLEINQEVSDAVITQTSGLNSPTIQQRSIRSIVSIQSGETVALGGLIRERAEAGESGLPVLKDIPILGAAFGTKTQDFVRTELLVLITPRVIRDAADARGVTEELRRRLTTLESVLRDERPRPVQ